jgi:hypothetical protein
VSMPTLALTEMAGAVVAAGVLDAVNVPAYFAYPHVGQRLVLAGPWLLR